MPEITESKYLVQCGWSDVPHLDEDTKRKLTASYLPHEVDARTKGSPSLGAGAVYPIPESEFVVQPFQIPDYWPRLYGLDVGWNRTSAIWGAWDRSSDTVYVNAEHYRGKAEPSIHAAAIKARGEWIPGVIDPASRGRAQKDGDQLLQMYKDLGLKISPALNGVDAGIHAVWELLSTGRLKVFKTMLYLLAEYKVYRRNEDGKIVKEFDHAMDALRYMIMSIKTQGIVRPAKHSSIILPSAGDPKIGY